MNTPDIKTLRAYLSVLEYALKFAEGKEREYAAEEEKAECSDDRNYYGRLRRFYEGKVAAYTDAINQLKELLSAELAEGEEEDE